ncbi:hypothetical protein BJV78DRAFT_791329 [Lactifluus subvellereus]|nr:hypothetical protein BJV78DRAFT_791329 [Lactifluus subvellereus]
MPTTGPDKHLPNSPTRLGEPRSGSHSWFGSHLRSGSVPSNTGNIHRSNDGRMTEPGSHVADQQEAMRQVRPSPARVVAGKSVPGKRAEPEGATGAISAAAEPRPPQTEGARPPPRQTHLVPAAASGSLQLEPQPTYTSELHVEPDARHQDAQLPQPPTGASDQRGHLAPPMSISKSSSGASRVARCDGVGSPGSIMRSETSLLSQQNPPAVPVVPQDPVVTSGRTEFPRKSPAVPLPPPDHAVRVPSHNDKTVPGARLPPTPLEMQVKKAREAAEPRPPRTDPLVPAVASGSLQSEPQLTYTSELHVGPDARHQDAQLPQPPTGASDQQGHLAPPMSISKSSNAASRAARCDGVGSPGSIMRSKTSPLSQQNPPAVPVVPQDPAVTSGRTELPRKPLAVPLPPPDHAARVPSHNDRTVPGARLPPTPLEMQVKKAREAAEPRPPRTDPLVPAAASGSLQSEPQPTYTSELHVEPDARHQDAQLPQPPAGAGDQRGHRMPPISISKSSSTAPHAAQRHGVWSSGAMSRSKTLPLSQQNTPAVPVVPQDSVVTLGRTEPPRKSPAVLLSPPYHAARVPSHNDRTVHGANTGARLPPTPLEMQVKTRDTLGSSGDRREQKEYSW